MSDRHGSSTFNLALASEKAAPDGTMVTLHFELCTVLGVLRFISALQDGQHVPDLALLASIWIHLKTRFKTIVRVNGVYL